MEHSDSDSFPENIRHGFTNRVPADPSRSNSLMSETSSQPDIHPFFKVSPLQNMWKKTAKLIEIHIIYLFRMLGHIF